MNTVPSAMAALVRMGGVPRSALVPYPFKVLHLAYRVFPDSAAARGEATAVVPEPPSQQQVVLARLTKGVHW